MSLEPTCEGAEGWESSVRVKEEWEEETDGQQDETDGVHIKDEPKWRGNLNWSLKSDVKEESRLLDLYAGHKVERDLVLGPEGPQLPNRAIAQSTCASSVSAGQAAGRGSGEPTPLQRPLHDKRFTASSRFVEQLKVYSGDRPFANQQLSPNGLTLHKPARTGARPYPRIGRRAHTGEKAFPCDKCSKKFSRKFNLGVHGKTHIVKKPHTCDVCMKQFTTKNRLFAHIRTHTDAKPYSCDVCMKQFTKTSNLVAHIRSHTGEKPYSCDVCIRQFTTKQGLVMHRRTHTGERPFLAMYV